MGLTCQHGGQDMLEVRCAGISEDALKKDAHYGLVNDGHLKIACIKSSPCSTGLIMDISTLLTVKHIYSPAKLVQPNSSWEYRSHTQNFRTIGQLCPAKYSIVRGKGGPHMSGILIFL